MLEANQLQAERINRYVLHGEGSARDALAGVFRILKTEELLAVVEWARAFNASGRGRFEITGYDMQDPRLALDSVLAFVGRRDPAFATTAESAYHDLREEWRAPGYPPKPDSTLTIWQAQSSIVRSHLQARRLEWLASARTRADSADIEWALQSAELVHQLTHFGDNTPGSVRDSAMAANIEWTLRQRPAGTRGIVWAHNAHVSRQPGAMGDYLGRRLPGQVRVFGFTTSGGEYSASTSWGRDTRTRGFGSFRIMPEASPSNGAAYALSRAGAPVSILDLRGAESSPDGRWLLEPRPFLYIGGMGQDYGYSLDPVAKVYDFLVYVQRTTASRPLR